MSSCLTLRRALGVGGLLLALACSPVRAEPAAPWTNAERALAAPVLTQAGQANAAALDDAALSRALEGYARTASGQRLHPDAVNRLWAISPAKRDLAAELQAARASGGLEAWLASLPPPYGPYKSLQSALSRYQAIDARGGWLQLAPGRALRRGETGKDVSALRSRLAAEGYVAAAPASPELFDAGLHAALASFQRHHGLTEDGVLNAQTRASLNVSAASRIDQIEANLERWRWLPHRLPPERIEVDVAGQTVRYFQADCETLSMKAVVGDPKHRTPMFASEIQAVTFNPPWNVPTSIAQAEILPKAAKNPGYLAANDFIFVDGRLQQKAGPKSALGQIKFELPSPFGVYLHDTPSKSAFSRTNRDLSHGCMRLEKPTELAALLLAPQGWTSQTVAAAIAAGRTQTVRLKTATPLYVLYWTASVDPAGLVTFRRDIYGWDHQLMDALAASAP